MSAVCLHFHQQRHSSMYATWGVPAYSVVVVVGAAAAAAELVPLAGLLAARCSVHFVLVLMPVLELGPEPEHGPELELEPVRHVLQLSYLRLR